jgi:polar amino acid transport system substrate-binding protein
VLDPKQTFVARFGRAITARWVTKTKNKGSAICMPGLIKKSGCLVAGAAALLVAGIAHAENLSNLPVQIEKPLLAPTGRLRVGVYLGSPTSMVVDPATKQTHGLAYDLGQEFAKRLQVPAEYITFLRVADIVSAIKNGEVDFTITNATAVRANDVSFSPTLLSIELGYLVPANSPIREAGEIDRPGVRIGVTRGSTSERTLPAKFKNATIVPAESVKLAVGMLSRGELDLYATNKPTLFEMSDAMPNARILDGNWGLEHLAIAIPKGREEALRFVGTFVEEVQSSGLLDQIEKQAGLRGAVKAEPR